MLKAFAERTLWCFFSLLTISSLQRKHIVGTPPHLSRPSSLHGQNSMDICEIRLLTIWLGLRLTGRLAVSYFGCTSQNSHGVRLINFSLLKIMSIMNRSGLQLLYSESHELYCSFVYGLLSIMFSPTQLWEAQSTQRKSFYTSKLQFRLYRPAKKFESTLSLLIILVRQSKRCENRNQLFCCSFRASCRHSLLFQALTSVIAFNWENLWIFKISVSLLSWQWKSAAGEGLVKSSIVHWEHAGAYEGPVAGSVRRLWACALHGGTVTKSKFAWDGPLALLLDGHHAGREGGRLVHLYQLLLVLEGRGSEAGTRGGRRSEERRRRRRSFEADRPHKLQCPCSHLPRLPGKHHHRLNERRVFP